MCVRNECFRISECYEIQGPPSVTHNEGLSPITLVCLFVCGIVQLPIRRGAWRMPLSWTFPPPRNSQRVKCPPHDSLVELWHAVTHASHGHAEVGMRMRDVTSQESSCFTLFHQRNKSSKYRMWNQEIGAFEPWGPKGLRIRIPANQWFYPSNQDCIARLGALNGRLVVRQLKPLIWQLKRIIRQLRHLVRQLWFN